MALILQCRALYGFRYGHRTIEMGWWRWWWWWKTIELWWRWWWWCGIQWNCGGGGGDGGGGGGGKQ